MKYIRLLLVLVFLLGAVGVSSNPAKAETFSQYVSGVTMQNLSSNSATVTASYYDSAGNVVDTTTDTISAYGVKDYASIPVDTGFRGSLVLSSDQPIGAVSTLRGDNKGRGAYTAAAEGSTTVTLPMLMKNWGSSNWNTWIAVQNTGTTSADISVDYAACASSPDRTETNVAPGAMVTFEQNTETCLTASKVLTSAVITSSQPVVAVVAQESSVVNASLVSTGFAAGDTNPVIPLMNSNNPSTAGWRTAISIFNQGSQSTDVTLTYVQASDGSTCTETQTIPSQSSIVFGGNNLITGQPYITCAAGARLVGSAYVTANTTSQPLVATVNQDRGGLASAYGATSASAGTPKVFFPQIQDRNGAVNQWASSIMVMNVGSSATFVKCSFTNSSYAPTSDSLSPLKSWEDLERGNIATNYVGSGQCTAYTDNTYTTIDTNAKIVAVVNVRGTGSNYDLMMSYEAMNVSLAN